MEDYSKDAKIFKAFCDEKRLKILDYLKSGEKCACVLIDSMGIGQSALSYHMKILCESGMVVSRQEGKLDPLQPQSKRWTIGSKTFVGIYYSRYRKGMQGLIEESHLRMAFLYL